MQPSLHCDLSGSRIGFCHFKAILLQNKKKTCQEKMFFPLTLWHNVICWKSTGVEVLPCNACYCEQTLAEAVGLLGIKSAQSSVNSGCMILSQLDFILSLTPSIDLKIVRVHSLSFSFFSPLSCRLLEPYPTMLFRTFTDECFVKPLRL